MDPRGPTPEPAVVYARVTRLVTGVVGQFSTMVKRMVYGFALAIAAGFVVGVVAREPLFGALVAFNGSLIVAAIAWWPLFDPAFRSAVELTLDHGDYERTDWKAETGTSMPCSRADIERWLARYPRAPGSASLLLALGRLPEADRAIETVDPSRPGATFAIELLRQTRRLYAGDESDLGVLHGALLTIQDPRLRRHRRECVALFEAQVAVDRGGDPIETMALARDEIGEVSWTMRTPWLLARWSLVALLVIAAMTALLAQVY
jgi:hypothetical protein